MMEDEFFFSNLECFLFEVHFVDVGFVHPLGTVFFGGRFWGGD